MTRLVTMSRDELDRRIQKAVDAALNPKDQQSVRDFRPVKDPVTGRIDMVAIHHVPWGQPGTSPAVVAAVGHLLYERCADEDSSDGLNFALIGLVRSCEFLSGHADEEELGRFARDFVLVAKNQSSGAIIEDCCLVLDLQRSDTGKRLSFGAEMTCESVIFTIFDRTTGLPTHPPVVFFFDDGDLGKEEADFSLTLDEMRAEDAATRRMLAKMRREARPAKILDMQAFRAGLKN